MSKFNLFIGIIFYSWKSLLNKWIDWGVDFQKLFELLQQVKKEDLLGFINGTHILTKPQKVMNYLAFLWTIKIPPVEKFKAGDFFKDKESAEFGMLNFRFNESFKSILEKIKDLEFSLEKEIKLNKFILKTRVGGTEIQSDFQEKPVIPAKIFIPLLKSLIEHDTQLDYSEKTFLVFFMAIFFVDFTEIDSDLGVVYISIPGVLGNTWNINAILPEYQKNREWDFLDRFFSLAT